MVDQRLEPSEIEGTLIRVINESTSLDLAVRVMDLVKRRRGQFFNIYENSRLSHLLPVLTSRLTQHFITEGRNIFNEEKNHAYILHQWGTSSLEEREKVNLYVFQLVRQDPRILGKIVSTYTRFWGKGKRIEVRRGDLAELYDEEHLVNEIKTNLESAYSNEEERTALRAFVNLYVERDKAASLELKKKADRAAFMEASSRAHALFSQGYHEKALEELDTALALTGWEDEHRWREQAKLTRWKVLLEVAYKNQGELQIKYFDEARKMAGTEAGINELIHKAYPNDSPDQAQLESYYCLFYYLLWNNSDKDQRGEIEHMFERHYTIATGNASSGRTDHILRRCYELKEKMNLK